MTAERGDDADQLRPRGGRLLRPLRADNVAIEGTEKAPGAMVDFDANGDAVGIEVLNVSKRGQKAVAAAGSARVAK